MTTTGDGTRVIRNCTLGELVRVQDEILKCECFIGYFDETKATEREQYLGTGWFFSFTEDTWTVITARHVIEVASAKGNRRLSVWVNTVPGAIWREDFDLDDWEFHEDESVDVAVLKKPYNATLRADVVLDHTCLMYSHFASSTQLEDVNHPIGIGDRLYFPGLLIHHTGKKLLRPIIRQGIIAAMNLEPVSTKIGGKDVEIDAYLAELHSIGGMSGSPVFVRGGFDHLNPGAPNGAPWPLPWNDPLLGLVHGHYELLYETGDKLVDKINAGICMIVPIKYVAEVLNQPKVVEVKKKLEESKPKPLKPSASPDSVEEDSLTKTADLVREVLKAPKKKKGRNQA